MKDKTAICDVCGGATKYYDKVKRIVRSEYGRCTLVPIERRICICCGSIHRKLPAYLLPFKHYEKRIVEGFISCEYSPSDIEFEDYPCETTIKNWKKSKP